MICPYCEKEMEAGVIQAQHELSWKKKRTFFLLPADHYEGAVTLSGRSMRGSAARAYLCRDCGKVIIDIENWDSDLNVFE